MEEKEKKLEEAIRIMSLHEKIHHTLSSLSPVDITENPYQNERYVLTLGRETRNLEKEFLELVSLLHLNEIENKVKVLFGQIYERIDSCSLTMSNIQDLYYSCFSNMERDFINVVNNNCIGYYLHHDSFQVMNKCTTLNELIHYLHAYFQNCYMSSSLPLLNQKKTIANENISLYGEKSDMGEEFFRKFPIEEEGITSIMSVANTLYIMVRDRGHALSMRVSKQENQYFIEYFIPKLINIEMIKQLKGISNIGDNWAQGVFTGSPEELFDFISKVPTDDDMDLDMYLKN